MMKGIKVLTQKRVKELFDYNSNTGVFTRVIPVRNGKIGPVGFVDSSGYLRVSVDGTPQLIHRLVWLYVYGYFPNVIDHINMIRTDNRLSNLRDTSYTINNQNTKTARPYNKSKCLGVSIRKSGQITAQIYINNKQIYLGTFKTVEDAQNAYLTEKRNLHDGCTI